MYSFTYEFKYNSYRITGYNGTDAIMILPNSYNDGVHGLLPVDEIKSGALKDNYYLQTVVISNSIRSINAYAFEDCTALKEIFLDRHINEIWDNAFTGCSSLENIYVLKEALTIHGNPFPDSVNNIFVRTDREDWYKENWSQYEDKIIGKDLMYLMFASFARAIKANVVGVNDIEMMYTNDLPDYYSVSASEDGIMLVTKMSIDIPTGTTETEFDFLFPLVAGDNIEFVKDESGDYPVIRVKAKSNIFKHVISFTDSNETSKTRLITVYTNDDIPVTDASGLISLCTIAYSIKTTYGAMSNVPLALDEYASGEPNGTYLVSPNFGPTYNFPDGTSQIRYGLSSYGPVDCVVLSDVVTAV